MSWAPRTGGLRGLKGGRGPSFEGRGAKCFFPPPGGFKVQQVQQIHKRPCLQEVSEFLKVQQKCNTKCNKVQQFQTPKEQAAQGKTLPILYRFRRRKTFFLDQA